MGSKTSNNFTQLYQNQLIKIIGIKNENPRALYFINQFASRHQYCIYNHKGKITI